MAVAIDVVSTCSGASVSSLSWTHTPSGTPTGVVVTVAQGFNTTAPNSISYGTDTPVDSGELVTPFGSYAIRVYGCPTSLTGAQTVSVGWAASKDTAILSAQTVTDSHATTIFSDSVAAGPTASTAISVDCPSATGELVIDATVHTVTGGADTAGASQTQSFQINQASAMRSCSSWEAGAATVTMSWSCDSTTWGTIAVSVQQAAAGGVTPRFLSLLGAGA